MNPAIKSQNSLITGIICFLACHTELIERDEIIFEWIRNRPRRLFVACFIFCQTEPG